METIGARLKKIRLEKGQSIEEVHKKTKIHLNILKAIEEDSLVNFSPVYIKGFLKIYCKFLEVDPKDFIPDYKEVKTLVKPVERKEEKHFAEPKISPAEKEKKRLPRISAVAPKFDFFRFFAGKIKIVFPVMIIIVILFGFLKLGKLFLSKEKHPRKAKKSTATNLLIPKLEKKIYTEKVQKPEEPVSAAYPKSTEEAAVPAKVRLGIRAKEDCWMQVKKDGKVIFQNVLKKGRFENWLADKKIELSLGNAGAVELEINGRIIPNLGRRGQSMKNILITREGLSTQR